MYSFDTIYLQVIVKTFLLFNVISYLVKLIHKLVKFDLKYYEGS